MLPVNLVMLDKRCNDIDISRSYIPHFPQWDKDTEEPENSNDTSKRHRYESLAMRAEV